MSDPLRLLLPAGAAGLAAGLGRRLVPYADGAELLGALHAGAWDEAVILSDLLAAGQLEPAAMAVRASGKPAIEVRSERWDGETLSPLSAACRGVISGFGANGLGAALAILAGSQPAANRTDAAPA